MVEYFEIRKQSREERSEPGFPKQPQKQRSWSVSLQIEAGMGSTPHAHAVAKVDHPVQQGYVAMIGVFIDTFIVLTMTALVIVTTRALPESYNAVSGGYTGAELSQFAYYLVYGKFGEIFIAICMFFFASSTIVGMVLFGEANISICLCKGSTDLSVICMCLCDSGSLAKGRSCLENMTASTV